MRIALLTCLPDNFLVCWPPVRALSVFTGISRRKYGELISPMGNQRVGVFPPKSKILFVLSLALIWCRNFQDRTIPVGGDTWSSFWRKETIRIRIKKYRVQGSRFRSNISETVRDIRVPFSLLGWCKSHATKRCNPRLCSCYRFLRYCSRQHQQFSDFTRFYSSKHVYGVERVRTP